MRQTLSRLPEPLRGCPRPTARVFTQKPVPRPPRATREVVEGRRGPAGGGKAWPQNGCWVGIRGAQPPSTPRPRYVVHTGEARPQRQPRRGRRRREARRLGGGGGGAAAACGHGSRWKFEPSPPTHPNAPAGRTRRPGARPSRRRRGRWAPASCSWRPLRESCGAGGRGGVSGRSQTQALGGRAGGWAHLRV